MIESNKKIVILGSSSKIDELENDFCKNNFVIGLNESYSRFDTFYPQVIHVAEPKIFEWIKCDLLSRNVDPKVKIILSNPMYPNIAPQYGYRTYPWDRGEDFTVRQLTQRLKLVQHGTPTAALAQGTCYHIALFIAVHLGAKNIFTVGIGDSIHYCKSVKNIKPLTKSITDPVAYQKHYTETVPKYNSIIHEALYNIGVNVTKISI